MSCEYAAEFAWQYSDGLPVLRINKIPVKDSRSSIGGLPPFGDRRLVGS